MLVHAMAKPLRVKRRAKKPPAAVFNPDHDRTAARRVRHAGDLVGQVPGRVLVMRAAHVKGAARPAPAGLFFEVNLFPLNGIGKQPGRQLG
jgi:hypothetical protein